MNRAKAKEIIMKNLEEAYFARSRKVLLFNAHIKELAYTLAKEISEEAFDDFELIAEHLRNRYDDIISSASEILPEEAGALLSGNDFRVSFCSYACDELASLGINIPYFKEFDDILDESNVKIGYFSNRSADEAYFEFLNRLPSATQLICDGITAVCEELSNGRCELCMLPIYNSADGIMQNVYRQSVRYALSMVMCLDIPADREVTIRFGLFAPNPCKTPKADMMQITVVCENACEIAKLPEALMAYGANFENINSVPPSIHDGSRAWTLTFSLENADISKIHLFLQMYFPRFEVNGIYEKVNSAESGEKHTEDEWTYGR
ncbi:MAG: hypothetical protein E7633_01435 [Ruminococcaceae bacterium]|nr:hypothetical protein [Oscillospiraceae bacterium]